MRIALDPYMYRHLPLGQMVDKAAELGYYHIELSPREDRPDQSSRMMLERVTRELCQ